MGVGPDGVHCLHENSQYTAILFFDLLLFQDISFFCLKNQDCLCRSMAPSPISILGVVVRCTVAGIQEPKVPSGHHIAMMALPLGFAAESRDNTRLHIN